MDENDVKKFLRYYWTNLVDFALDEVNLTDAEKEAVELCGRRGLTAERASEEANPPVSVNTMQTRWQNARKRLLKAWSCYNWIKTLADTMDD